MLITQATFAKKIGRSRQYINKLVHKGIIPTYDKKKVKYKEALKIIEDIKDPRRDAQRKANSERRKSDLFSVSGTYESVADMSKEEKKKEFYNAKQKLKEIEEESKKLGLQSSLPEDIDSLGIKELNVLILKQDLRIKTIKADEVEKNVVPIEDVNQQLFVAARMVRDGLLGIPARIASRLAAQSDAHSCRTMLEVEINEQLNNLVEVFYES